jgi:hypothetical protein
MEHRRWDAGFTPPGAAALHFPEAIAKPIFLSS